MRLEVPLKISKFRFRISYIYPASVIYRPCYFEVKRDQPTYMFVGFKVVASINVGNYTFASTLGHKKALQLTRRRASIKQ